jgi:hypothetical protein
MFTVGLLLAGALSALAGDPSYEADVGLIPPGGFIVFYNSQGPLSYRTLTLKDLPAGTSQLGEVRVNNCQHAVSIPLNLVFRQGVTLSGVQGNGGFKKAMASLQRDYPQVDGIFDVKIDMHELSILGLYARECTEIVARGFRVPKTPVRF